MSPKIPTYEVVSVQITAHSKVDGPIGNCEQDQEEIKRDEESTELDEGASEEINTSRGADRATP